MEEMPGMPTAQPCTSTRESGGRGTLPSVPLLADCVAWFPGPPDPTRRTTFAPSAAVKINKRSKSNEVKKRDCCFSQHQPAFSNAYSLVHSLHTQYNIPYRYYTSKWE
ncbi:hypothetical protein LY78DRAFT_660606 [Colletotrichum sublineola]|nr:hypothetical protein LY78DRAFT_660606 [Colletotrichum sublineola]